MKRAVVSLMLASIAGLVPFSVSAADRILFSRHGPSQATIYVSRADGTGEQPLLPPGGMDYDPAWSAKGDWIVFTSERDGSADLYRVHRDGSGLERLTDNPAYDDQAAFSPDGGRLVFVSTRGAGFANLWTLDIASRKARQVTTGHGGDFRPAWSPDGRWIAFSSDRTRGMPPAKGRWERLHLFDIYVVHPDGTGLKRLTSDPDQVCGSPKWSADSQSVVAYCLKAEDTWDAVGSHGEFDDRVVRIDLASGHIEDLAAGPGNKAAPTVLPSGTIGYLRRDAHAKGIFYSDGGKGPAGSSSGGQGLADADLGPPAWSPDGGEVAYTRYVSARRAEPARVWSKDPAFEFYNTAVLPAVDAPRNRFVTTVPMGSLPDLGSTLVLIEDGKPPRTILKQDQLMVGPQWSADGKHIVLGLGKFETFPDPARGPKKPVDVVDGGAQVAMLDDDGGNLHIVTSGQNNNAFASFAPDGRRIVYRTKGPEGQGLRILDLQSQAVSKLTGEWDTFPLWSPRGDLIAFVRRLGHNYHVFTIKPDGSGLKQLTHGEGNNAHLAWSPDGTQLLYSGSAKGFKDEVFYTASPQAYGEIFVMNADGTGLRQLTDDQWEEGGPAWMLPARPAPAAP